MKLYIKQEDVKNWIISYSGWHGFAPNGDCKKGPMSQHTEFDISIPDGKTSDKIYKKMVTSEGIVNVCILKDFELTKIKAKPFKSVAKMNGIQTFSFIQHKPYKPRKEKKPSLHDVLISAGMKECYIKPEVTFGVVGVVAGENINAGRAVSIIAGKAYNSESTIDGGRKATEVEILKGNAFWDHNKMAWWIK